MKNRRIRFDDKLYMTTLSLLFSIGSLMLLIICIDHLLLWGYIILTIMFSLFLSGFFAFLKMGIHFNYKSKTIKYFGQYKISKSLIKMCEIEEIIFKEVCVPKKKGIVPKNYVAYDKDLSYVYRNGKIYEFHVYLKNGEIVKIPYLNLFKVSNKKRIMKQETRINKIINEFNSFTGNK